MPWRWSQFDRLAFQFFILGFGVLFFRIIVPLIDSTRFPITKLDSNHLAIMAALVAGVFVVPFSFRRRSSSFAGSGGLVQGLFLVLFGAAMTEGAFFLGQNSVQALVMNDVERSCMATETRRVADCTNSVTEAEHVIGHALGSGQKSQIDAFLKTEALAETLKSQTSEIPNPSPAPVETVVPSPAQNQQAARPEIQ